ncbi:10527_t:CDS:2, partial [Ambispora leptoticha]
MTNLGIIYKKLPNRGLPSKTEHFEIVHRNIDIQNYELSDGDILGQKSILVRGSVHAWSYARSQRSKLEGSDISEVIKSKSDRYKVGDLIYAMIGWEQYTHIPVSKIATNHTIFCILPSSRKLPLSYYVGVLGIIGLTAYVGLKGIGKSKAGETIYISGFLVFDHFQKYNADFIQKISKWLSEGKIRYRKTVTEGIEDAPDAFLGHVAGRESWKG